MISGKRLEFKKDILSTISKPIPTKELLNRLNALNDELSTLDQDNVDLISLETIKDDLINKKLIKHSNKGVQIYVSCCLANILRLFAPDAPYDNSDLNNIFKLFIQQFNNLSDTESPYYENYVKLLEIITEVKLIALVTDLSTKDKLIPQIFEIFYSLSANKSFDIDLLQQLLINILSEIISEVNQLDMNTLKLIFNKFLANSKNLKNQSNIKVPGFEISLALCEINSDKISRFVTFFFSELILEATNKNEELDLNSDSDNSMNENPDNDSDNDENIYSSKKLSKIDLIQLKKIHNLAVELWRFVPEILTSVLGLLDNELEADDARIRILATDTTSKILAIQPSRINFPTTYLGIYMNWLKKSLDISIDIRITWLNHLTPILESRNDITNDIVNGILKTMIDSNEKVRLDTIIELTKLKPSTFLKNILNKTLMDTLLKLLREKNISIRNEIIQFLATLYNFANVSKKTATNDFTDKIPINILDLIYINDNIVNSELDLALFEKIIPFESNNKIRVNNLLSLICLLTKKSQTAFLAIIKRQTQLSKVILQLLLLIESELDSIDKQEQVNHAIKWISKSFPASYNFDLYMHYFLELNNKRFFRLLKLCATQNSDYDTIVNSMKELFNRVNDPKILSSNKNGLNSTGMYNVIKLLLLRCSNIFYNISNISELVIVNNDTLSDLHEAARLTLNNISEICPSVLESHIKELSDSISVQIDKLDFNQSRISNDCWRDLNTIYNYLEKNNSIQLNKKFYDTLYDLSIKGTVLEAKYAIKIISYITGSLKGSLFTGIVNKIWPLNIHSSKFNTHLSSLSMLFIYDLLSVDHIKEEIGKFLASEVLLKNHNINNQDHNEENVTTEKNVENHIDWISDNDLYYNSENKECLSKILAMKLLTNWLISAKDDPMEDIETLSKPILSMLSSFINRGGEIVPTDDTPSNFCSRLRLHAGVQLLKISQISVYDPFIDQRRINRLILLIQDVELQVRSKFLTKLKKRLTQNRISKRFLSLIFFSAHEPDLTLKSETITWIKASFVKQNNNNKNTMDFEKSYIRLLYMLAIHPEFKDIYLAYKSSEGTANEEITNQKSTKFKEMSDFALTYIVFSLTLILTSENSSFLYYLSQRIKQFEGVNLNEIDDQYNDSLYFISELSQSVINHIGKIRNWNIAVWNGKLTLPADLFNRLDNDTANKVIKTAYIPDDYTNLVTEIIRAKWRAENGLHVTKTPKRRDNNIILQELNIQQKKTIESDKPRKRKKIQDNDNTDYQSSRKYTAPETISRSRRTRRGRRINYTEE